MALVEIDFPGNIASVATIADLRALPSSGFLDADLYIVRGKGAYTWSASSLATDDGDKVLRPVDITPLQAGRWLYGPQGSPGSSDNTYSPDNGGLAAFKASDIGRKTASLVGVPGVPDGRFNWTLGDFTGQADDSNIIKADSTALSVGAWVRQLAGGVAYRAPITGAPTRDLATAKDDLFTAKDAGAAANGTVDDQPAFVRAATNRNDIVVTRGVSRIGTGTIGEFQKPLRVQGTSHASQIVVDNPDKRAFRVGAVGGDYGDFRAITKWDTLTFRAPAGLAKPYALTAIDVQAVFPFTAEDCTFLSLGADAIKGTNLYYGYLKGLQLVNSGITFSDVNVLSLMACEFRGDDRSTTLGGEGVDAGKPLFGNVGRYPLELIESDQIKMYGGLFEAYHCPIILLRRSYNTVFNGVWFEGNPSATHLIRWEQAQSLDFINSQLDFAIPYAPTGSFINVTMAGPEPNSENVSWVPYIRLTGGYLLLTSIPNGDAGRFVSVVNGESVVVEVSGVSFRGGNLWADRTVSFDVKSILLSGALKHSFYSRPNAALLRERNSWVIGSQSNDWDFADTSKPNGGANFVSTNLAITTTTTAGQFLTGARGVRVTGFVPGEMRQFSRTTTGEIGAITSGSGQTYLAYMRVKFDADGTAKFDISNGAAAYAGTPNVIVKGGEWYDFVFKTGQAETQAQGLGGTPSISLSYQPASSGAGVSVDRIDYRICTGDYVI